MLDIEFIDEPKETPLNIESYYQDLMKAFEWVNNPQGEKRIKQCIDNITTSVYQKGQMNTQHRVNSEIQTLIQRVKELEERYEPRQKSQERYKERSDRFVND